LKEAEEDGKAGDADLEDEAQSNPKVPSSSDNK